MEPRKKKVFKYYAVPCGSNVAIYRTTGALVRVKSILRLPKFPGSPKYHVESGALNRGAIFSQLCYTGASLQGTLTAKEFYQTTGLYTYHDVTKLNLAQKRAIRKFLEDQDNERNLEHGYSSSDQYTEDDA